MKSYGQFCPLALAAEIVGERWTPLILRELILGAIRFNEIHRGVPRMSPALLTRRLRALESAGIVRREKVDRQIEYHLTEAGRELSPAIETLAIWGKTWLPATLNDGQADTDQVMWDIPKRMNLALLPESRTVVQFRLVDQEPDKRLRWIVGNRNGVELCIVDPGFDVDLYLTSDRRTILWVWSGDIPIRDAIAEGLIELDGPRELREAFPSWLRLGGLAAVRRRYPLRAS